MPGKAPEDHQNALTHVGADPETDKTTHNAADEVATVLQPNGEELERSADLPEENELDDRGRH